MSAFSSIKPGEAESYYQPFNLYSPIENLFLMARPGSREAVTGKAHPEFSAEEERTNTVDWLIRHACSHVISLSDREHAASEDPAICELLSTMSEGLVAFTHIPHEDHVDNPKFIQLVDGPTAEKMKRYTEICLPIIESGGMIATYCGAGIGRSLVNGAALLIAMGRTRKEALETCYSALTGAGVHERDGLTLTDDIKLELLANGGARALVEFEELMRPSPDLVTALHSPTPRPRKWGNSVLGRTPSFDFKAALAEAESHK